MSYTSKACVKCLVKQKQGLLVFALRYPAFNFVAFFLKQLMIAQ